MNLVIALALLGGAGFYLWRTGALGGILPSHQIETGLLMDPPKPPVPTAPTTHTSGMGGGGLIGGLIAGVGLLTYAIVDRGLFRGGEEGVKTNPARDRFFQQFIDWCARNVPGWQYGTTSAAQQPAAATVLGYVVDGNRADTLIRGVYGAHTINDYVTAASAMAEALQPWADRYGVRIEIPT
jgi:hypothetical protein